MNILTVFTDSTTIINTSPAMYTDHKLRKIASPKRGHNHVLRKLRPGFILYLHKLRYILFEIKLCPKNRYYLLAITYT